MLSNVLNLLDWRRKCGIEMGDLFSRFNENFRYKGGCTYKAKIFDYTIFRSLEEYETE